MTFLLGCLPLRHKDEVHFHFPQNHVQFEFEGVSSQRPAVVKSVVASLPLFLNSYGSKSWKLWFQWNQVGIKAHIWVAKGDQGKEASKCEQPANDLRRHLKMYGSEKSSKCNQCDFTCSYARALRTHLKTHSGEKPNKCNHCDSAFSQAGNLRTHLKTHNGEKSNKCNLCDYACSDPSSLRAHMKRHNGGKNVTNVTNWLCFVLCKPFEDAFKNT